MESGNNHIDRQFSELISTSQSVSPCVIILDNVETVIPDRKKLANNDEYVDEFFGKNDIEFEEDEYEKPEEELKVSNKYSFDF